MLDARDFERQTDPQGQSDLLQLPGELRLKVLRYLLKSKDGRIRSYDESKLCSTNGRFPRKRYNKELPGSAQLLRTCQKLFWEGRDVLYTENTLSIFIWGDPWSRALKCGVLGLQVEFHRPHQETYYDLLWNALDYNPDDMSQLLRVYDETLACFQRLEIKMDELNDHEDCFIACRVLKNNLLGKDVTIDLDTAKGNFEEHHCGLEDGLLSGFKFLRCNSIHFKNYKVHTELVAQIESEIPVNDTYRSWWNLEHGVFDDLPVNEERAPEQFSEVYITEIEDLFDAAVHYDLHNFNTQRSQILKLAIKRNEQEVERRCGFLDDLKNRINTDFGALNKEISDPSNLDTSVISLGDTWDTTHSDMWPFLATLRVT
ncbi:hypothetical protein LTR05_005763 [Lithohypha guttulata]|uniref:Uncharacterized protein n=1 Tax=Lithohypha guttulata TaxID=1690604 RepID=A0AAN7SYM8_9EURO|nr:hypothetical protein LTR05_005763 [Lithohypha guttulata]